MAAARQGLPVRLDRAPQRGAAFALTMRANAQGKWPDQTLDQAFGLPEVLVAVSTSRLSCKRAGKTRTLMPVWDSSGESWLMSADGGHSPRLGDGDFSGVMGRVE